MGSHGVSPSSRLSEGHTQCLDYRALLFWAQEGSLSCRSSNREITGHYRAAGVGRADCGLGSAQLRYNTRARLAFQPKYKAFICHKTRFACKVAPRVCVCVQLNVYVVLLAKSSVFSVLLSPPSGNVSADETGCDMCGCKRMKYCQPHPIILSTSLGHDMSASVGLAALMRCLLTFCFCFLMKKGGLFVLIPGHRFEINSTLCFTWIFLF